MRERLSRGRWARLHTGSGWREITAAVVVGTIYLAAWRHYRWGPDVRPEVWAVVAACLGAALVWLGEFAWQFGRARVVQDRAELGVAHAIEKYFRRELGACLDAAEHRLSKVPATYKLASAEWLARNPEVQEQLERCRAEVERLRKIIEGIPPD